MGSQSLDNARAHADVGLPIPPGTRFRFAKRLVARLSWLYLHHQVSYNNSVVAELDSLGDEIDALRSGTVAETAAARAAEAALGAAQAAQIAELRELISSEREAHRLQLDLLQRQTFERHHEAVGSIRSEIAELSLRAGEARREAEGRLADLVASELRNRAELQLRLAQIDLFLDRLRRSLPGLPEPATLEGLPSTSDNAYAALEEVFRGSSDVVRDRAAEYLDDILGLDRRGPVADLGSGRGEWLELLREKGVDAYGIEVNELFAADCAARGLDVRVGDLRAVLAKVPERSLSAVTGFHVVEHMDVDGVVELIDLAVRALHPDGLLILETPNPDNLVVGSSTFYIDPTHVRPLNPDFLKFLVGGRGLTDVEVRMKHPDAGLSLGSPVEGSPWAEDVLPLVQVINNRFFGPRDYAVVARRV